MRIAPKAVASNTATPEATVGSPKSGPVSFLDILMNGVGVGVQAADASGAQKQSSSQANPSDPANTDEENAQPASSQAAMSASPSTQSSATWLTKDANALTAMAPAAATADAAQPTPSSKTSANAPQNAHGKAAATSAVPATTETQPAPTVAVTVPVPVPAEPLPALVTATSSLQSLRSQMAADATDAQPAQTANRADAQQSGPTSAQTTAPTTRQDLLHAAPAVVDPLLEAAQNLPQTSAQDSANQDTQQVSAPVAAQVSNQGFAVPATPSVASTFLTAAISPNAITASQFTGKLSQFKTADVTFTAKAGAQTASANAATTTGVTGTAKNNTQDASSSTGKNNNQAGSDSTAHSQVGASPAAGAGAKATDNNAATFGTLVAAHEATPAHGTASGTADATTHAAAEPTHLPADSGVNAAGPIASAAINSARVIQSMSESEMRVGMHSSEFGDISIRTMVSQQQVQAQISVDHNELSSAISAHIPTMQAKFGSDLGLHATIEVSQSGMSFSGERGQSSPREQKSFSPTVPVDTTPAPIEMDRVTMRAASSYVDGSRLDIRA